MSFLFPLYLLGALAIALPILMHLRKRPPKERIPFGSLMFLEKSPEKLTRRTRIERWILLALRCLALLALALVFGRPFLKSATLPSELPEASLAVILVDRSASMQRENLAGRAIEAAEKAVRERKTEDEVAVLFFDRDTVEVAGFEEWSGMAAGARAGDFRKKITSLPNGWDISNPGKALIEAADMVAARAGEREFRKKEIVLISDFQEGARFDDLNQFAWPEDLTVESVLLSPKKAGNLNLTLAATTEESRTAVELVHRVRIANSAESEFDRFELRWKGLPGTSISGVVPPGSSRVLSVPSPPEDAGELVLSGDEHSFDNSVYVAPPLPVPLRILFLTDRANPDQVGSPFFYLKRALHPTASLIPTAEAAAFSDWRERADEASAVIVHGNWTREIAGEARGLAEQGKLVVALPDADTAPEAFFALFDWTGARLKESGGDDYVMLANLDFEHPVLAPFARARIRDFTKIRFWKHRELVFREGRRPAGLEVLAEFDNGAPAWMVDAVGDGSIFAFLSGWEPAESQFALSSKFVPVLYSIFENAGYSAKTAPAFYVGDVEVLKEGKMERATRPGIFSTESPNGEAPISINLHPSEGRVDPVDPGVLLADFNIPLKAEAAGNGKENPEDPVAKKRMENEEKEARQKLWKWFVIAVILFLIAETWLAGRRRHVPAQVPA